MRALPAIGLFFLSTSAMAAPPRPAAQKLTRVTEASSAMQEGRSRMAKGDCKGALDAFDLALRSIQEATLFRDRGMCHEKLGHSAPAAEDFRVYLTMAPDAKDSEDIRMRLSQLEGNKYQSADAEDPNGSHASANAEFSIGGAKSKLAADAKVAETAANEDAENHAIRNGTGWVVGPYFGLRKQLGSTAPSDIGFMVGASLRYSASRSIAAVFELGYTGFGKSGDGAGEGGIQMMVGGELKLALNKPATDQIFGLVGVGYERYKQPITRMAANAFFLPRVRFGYRHVFGPAVGLEFAFDGGAFLHHVTDAPLGGKPADEFRGMVGAGLALVVGF